MRRLLIFLKEPRPGFVKTRLARAVGPEAASEVARACAERLLERLRPFQKEAAVYVTPPEAIPRVQAWIGGSWTVRAQRGGTLGVRLHRAAQEALKEGARQVLLIGTDSPWLAPEDVERAFRALDSSDMVLGPAEDGGYYLLGVRGDWPALFRGIVWGTEQVSLQTLARAGRLALSVRLLPTGYDVDRYEDLQRFLAERR